MEGNTSRKAWRAVFVSNVFPNHLEPMRGTFTLRQLLAMSKRGWVFDVIAPVSWFPLHRSRYGPPASSVRPQETVEGLRTEHPRAFYVPLSRGALNARLYEWSIRRSVRRACQAGEPSFVWSSFAFPDGVAAGRIARRLGLPHVASVLGSDIHIGLEHPGRRSVICQELAAARVVLAKSAALRDLLVEQGVDRERVVVDYNGVDTALFRFRSAHEARKSVGLPERSRCILFVGWLVPVKSVDILIEAFARLTASGKWDLELALVGDGYLRRGLEAQAVRCGVGSRTRFLGRLGPEDIARWMNASDLLCLPSQNEGVPNVVLEALASGSPVVATRVGGLPEVHPGEAAGALVPPGDAEALARALADTLSRSWDRPAIAESMRGWSWDANAERIEATFRSAGLVN